jgi:hypothetical protein
MSRGKPIGPTVKAGVVSKIRNDGMGVSEASTPYGISHKSICYRLRGGAVDGNRHLILENNKLKKENEQLYKLLGRATAEMQKSKN